MSEEISQKKTEVEEPVKPENGVILKKSLDTPDKTGVFFQKSLKYVLTPEKKKQDTIDRQDEYIRKFKSQGGGSYAVAYTLAKIPRQTFWDWYHNDNEFKKRLLDIRNKTDDLIEDSLITKAVGGNVSAMRIYLESNHPKYSKKLKVETTYTGDKTLEDLIAEDEQAIDEHNKKVDELNQENKKGQSVVHSEHPEDKKQEGEDSPISA